MSKILLDSDGYLLAQERESRYNDAAEGCDRFANAVGREKRVSVGKQNKFLGRFL